MKFSTIIYLCFFACLVSFSQGFNWDDELEQAFSEWPEMEVTRSIFPSKYSLERYFPFVLNQGETGMCMAYSLVTARTILYASNNNILDERKIRENLFSPFFSYKLAMEGSDINCTDGLNPLRTLFYAKKHGMVQAKDIEKPEYYPYSENRLSCGSYPNSKDDLMSDIVLASRYNLGSCQKISSVNQLKESIAGKKPVVFGFDPLPVSFEALGHWGENFWDKDLKVPCYYKFEKYDKITCKSPGNPDTFFCERHKPEGPKIGHAMVVIGYDDDKFGGSFLVLNSWGEDWGDNGKMWVKYNDFFEYLSLAVSIDAEEKTDFWKPDRNKLSAPNIENMIIKKPSIIKNFSLKKGVYKQIKNYK